MYFVRDGNHRVSVAKAQGAEFIDAEVISLSSEIALSTSMSLVQLKQAVIDFEKRRFYEETRLDSLPAGCLIEFTEVGRYEEILAHIREHKWYMNLKKTEEIPFEQAAVSWYDAVYFPIVTIITGDPPAGAVPADNGSRPVRLRGKALERAERPLRAPVHPRGGCRGPFTWLPGAHTR